MLLRLSRGQAKRRRGWHMALIRIFALKKDRYHLLTFSPQGRECGEYSKRWSIFCPFGAITVRNTFEDEVSQVFEMPRLLSSYSQKSCYSYRFFEKILYFSRKITVLMEKAPLSFNEIVMTSLGKASMQKIHQIFVTFILLY